ncbi:MAG: DUF4112 domain-containing protein [Gammaproteobacteria bacterium]|nr:DUF4112 domain-containing protein [Gammaproteobacteria bacterium]MCP5458354.1 DUF4112 domain-containing protein [Gammaproteobacteria bacterium]
MSQQNSLDDSSAKAQKIRNRVKRLAWLLDDSIPVPIFGKYRIGVDGIIGFIPGIGDAIGAVLSLFILEEAARLGVPKSILSRMLLNVAIESMLGLIPLAGDVFDMAWKANLRNVKLIDSYLDSPQAVTRSSRFIIIGIVAVSFLFVGFISLIGLMILKWFIGLFV